jgi:alkanesulfonate monooxygenase SsuD/methylene tetrahydromethanopterin reductase-like flavin-dependent oxidoreductase (luciferase family)
MIKPWIFEFFRAPVDPGILVPHPRQGVSPLEVTAHFANYWQRWIRAEEYGFEGIFFSEHHFGPGYSPSPNLLIAALASVTKRLRLGVMGVVLPYYQPWRVIEEIGMLDHLTQGRLEVGTASGIPPEMAFVGLGVGEANERNAEAQNILDWALTHRGEPISHHSKYWNFDDLTLVPATLQEPSPPRWTTIVSEGSARRSALRGTKICTGFSSVAVVSGLFNAYRDEADKAEFRVNPDFLGLRRIVTVASDQAEAQELSARVFEQARTIFLKQDSRVNFGPVPDAPQKASGGFQLSLEEYIAGTPPQVAEQIIEQCRATGAGHFLAMLDCHGGERENQGAFDLFGREVLPLLHRAILGREQLSSATRTDHA